MVHDALRLARIFHNLKQRELAEALDISPSYLNEIESGKKQVTITILQKYAEHFRIPVSSLLYFAERQNRSGGRPSQNPIAAKALKMLDWVETITRDDDDKVPS